MIDLETMLRLNAERREQEIAALLHAANDPTYWLTLPKRRLWSAALCFANFGANDQGLIIDPRNGYCHNPAEQ